MYTLLCLQILAHLFADFTFQPQRWCEVKEKKGLSRAYFYHVLIVFIFSWFFSLSVGFWWASLLISAVHLAIDLLKNQIKQTCYLKKYIFLLIRPCI